MATAKRIVLGSVLVLLAPFGSVWPLSSVLTADPSNYQSVVSGLRPGDTLTLAAGSYSGDLWVSGLNGSPGAWITIQGPTSGAPAVFLADPSNNTINISNSSYVALKNITCDGQHLAGPFAISANGGSSNVTHDILIEGCTLQNYDGSQQTDGISTKAPAWNWVIRGNRLLGVGTGIYLGKDRKSVV